MLNSATARLAFLISLAHSGNVTISAEFAGISRSSLYSWRLQDAEFAESWDCAMHESLDRLKEAARRRAIDLLFELMLGMLGMAGIRSFDKLRGITR